MANKKIRVALVGMGFGSEFVPIYKDHPNVESVAICDSDRAVLDRTGDRCGIADRYTDINEIIASDRFDTVHLITPIPLHAEQSVAVLKSGKHCACTVPMATSIEDIRRIIAAKRESGRTYMMMETAVYTRQYLLAKEMLEKGELGRLQFLRGAHYQDMENWPSYWCGLPPMHYATHAISPILALAKSRAVSVHCFGSGVMRPELQKLYHNPYPVETAIFQLETPALAAEVTRTLFHTAVGYLECFSVYGDKGSMEWPQAEHDGQPVIFTMGPVVPGNYREINKTQVEAPYRKDLLPKEIAFHTEPHKVEIQHRSYIQGGSHGGSHPHLVNEFVSSIVENRRPFVDEISAANWTAAGICAHTSAMNHGQEVQIPSFE